MKNKSFFQNKKNLFLICFAVLFGLILGLGTKVFLVKALDIGKDEVDIGVKGNLDMDASGTSRKIKGLANPSSDQDAATWNYTKQAVNGEDPDGTGVGLWHKDTSSGSGDIYTNSNLVGNVGIGKNPTFKFQVASNAGANTVKIGDDLIVATDVAVGGSINTGGSLELVGTGNLSLNDNYISNDGDDEGIRINNDGNVGIGTTNMTKALNIGGEVDADAFFYTSDKRLKDNIKPLKGALDKVLKLRGVEFSWKNKNKDDRNIGLIAQEVEKVYPEVVSTDLTTDKKSLEYANLIAPLIESIKELYMINEIQNQKIQLLRQEVR